ncbi:MAG: hypothetical protein HYY40_02160 [Bacteroidetes bacterium]|nr:hypothetical protein [Bacteroidota bacterium]
MDNPWFQGVVGGLIAGIISAIIIWLYKKLEQESIHDDLYSKYEGNYNQYLKRTLNNRDSPETNEEKIIVAEIKLTRSRNKFILNGTTITNNPEDKKDAKFNGEIIMDERMPLYGRGYYKHKSTSFGFYEVQMDSKIEEFYVHRIYYSNNAKHVAGYIWEKVK